MIRWAVESPLINQNKMLASQTSVGLLFPPGPWPLLFPKAEQAQKSGTCPLISFSRESGVGPQGDTFLSDPTSHFTSLVQLSPQRFCLSLLPLYPVKEKPSSVWLETLADPRVTISVLQQSPFPSCINSFEYKSLFTKSGLVFLWQFPTMPAVFQFVNTPSSWLPWGLCMLLSHLVHPFPPSLTGFTALLPVLTLALLTVYQSLGS